ncbi:MAG: MBL fold metallo-hydrolase [Methanobacterium sp.]|uniref:MBL fold metallo-hydrolase n=1 Tax=Methanobacterium sp. TaxID=2164 RepID=UPI003D64E314|nr:MBL fold metallo-hydrolase [Methanobacterium sp.]
MKTWNTENCTIYQLLKDRSNSFLINQGNNYILVDTGHKNSYKGLKTKLDELLGENKLSCLILTHTHFDHAENASRIKEMYKCPIIAHESEADYLKHGNTPLPKGTNILTRFLIKSVVKRVNPQSEYETATPDILVCENYDLWPLGFNAYIIHTPGHTIGSMSIIIDSEVALVGDTLFGVFNWSTYPPFADDPKTMIKSWGKLLSTDCRLFLPGHGRKISRRLLEKQYEKHKR